MVERAFLQDAGNTIFGSTRDLGGGCILRPGRSLYNNEFVRVFIISVEGLIPRRSAV